MALSAPSHSSPSAIAVLRTAGSASSNERKRAALMQIDDDVCERLDAPSLRAEDQDGLSIIDQPPGRRKAELALIIGKSRVRRRFGGIQLGGAAPVRKRWTQGRSSPTRRLRRAVGEDHTTSPKRSRVGRQSRLIRPPG